MWGYGVYKMKAKRKIKRKKKVVPKFIITPRASAPLTLTVKPVGTHHQVLIDGKERFLGQLFTTEEMTDKLVHWQRTGVVVEPVGTAPAWFEKRAALTYNH
jgi:hypothetical protein